MRNPSIRARILFSLGILWATILLACFFFYSFLQKTDRHTTLLKRMMVEKHLDEEIDPQLKIIRAERERSFRILLVLAGSGTLLFILLAFWLTRLILRPIEWLRRSMIGIRQGRPGPARCAAARGELDRLLRTWNATRSDLDTNLKTARLRLNSLERQQVHFFKVVLEEAENALRMAGETTPSSPSPEKEPRKKAEPRSPSDRKVEQILFFLQDLAEIGALSVSKSKSRKSDNENMVIDLNALARKAIQQCKPYLAAKNLDLRFQGPEGSLLFNVLVDPVHINKAVMNLLSHVFRTAMPGSDLTVSLRALGPDAVTFCVSFKSSHALFAETRFLAGRLHDSRTRVLAGNVASLLNTGLALPLTRAIVHHYGGVMKIKMNRKNECAITLQFPVSLEANLEEDVGYTTLPHDGEEPSDVRTTAAPSPRT